MNPQQAGDSLLGALRLGLILQPVDLAQDRPLLELNLRFRQVGFRLLDVGEALLRITFVLGGFLPHLMGKVLVLRLRFAKLIDLQCPVKFRQDVTCFHS